MKDALLTVLRNKDSSLEEFRSAAHRLAHLVAAETAISSLQEKISIETPLARSEGFRPKNPVTLVAILRAALVMLPPFLNFFPKASVGFLGIKRDESTARPIPYYENLPELTSVHDIYLLDPMIATGGSAKYALERLLALGVSPSQITLIGFIAAKEGLSLLKSHFQTLKIKVVAQDAQLNAHKFIVPGLGDFGDRYFGTS